MENRSFEWRRSGAVNASTNFNGIRGNDIDTQTNANTCAAFSIANSHAIRSIQIQASRLQCFSYFMHFFFVVVDILTLFVQFKLMPFIKRSSFCGW